MEGHINCKQKLSNQKQRQMETERQIGTQTCVAGMGREAQWAVLWILKTFL